MKHIVFYSFRGTDTQVFLPLLFNIPKDIRVTWVVQEPQLGAFMYMDHSGVTSLTELGIKPEPFDGNSVRRKFYNKINSVLGLSQKDVYERKFDIKTLFPKSGFKIISTYKDPASVIRELNPDAVLITTLWIKRTIIKIMKEGRIPFFYHNYGHTIKPKAIFEARPEIGNLLHTMFHLAPREYKKAQFLEIKHVLTGASKLDLFFVPEIFPRPVKKSFGLYCSSISNTSQYPKELSEPQKWAPYLEKVVNNAGLEFVAKWHPNSMQQYKNLRLVKHAYSPTYQYDVLRQAKFVIADPTALLVDVLILDKPLFLIKTPLKEWDNYKIFKKACYMITGNKRKDIELIKSVLKNDWLKSERKKLLKEWWYKADGSSSDRVWKEIVRIG